MYTANTVSHVETKELLIDLYIFENIFHAPSTAKWQKTFICREQPLNWWPWTIFLDAWVFSKLGLELGLGLWCSMPLSTIFQLYCGSQFYRSRNWSTQRKPPTVASHWQTLSHNVVLSTPCHERDLNSQH
jgi:hypothetical protein